MSTVLLVGVGLAAALVAAGGVAYLVRAGGATAHYGTFGAVAQALRDPAMIVRGALALEPAALIQLGLIVLVLTPVARVVFALLAFAEQRDRLYVLFSLIVLVVLTISLTGHVP